MSDWVVKSKFVVLTNRSAKSPGIIVQNTSPEDQCSVEKNSIELKDQSLRIFPAVECFRIYRRKALTKSNGSKRGPERK